MSESIVYTWNFPESRRTIDLLMQVYGPTDFKDFVILAKCATIDENNLLSWNYSHVLGDHFCYSPETSGPGPVKLPTLSSTLPVRALSLEVAPWRQQTRTSHIYFGECWASSPYKTSLTHRNEATIIELAERTERS